MDTKNQFIYYSKSPLKLNNILVLMKSQPIFLKYLMKAEYVMSFYVSINTEDLQLFQLCMELALREGFWMKFHR
jgi:hypothetical protein